jgi:hypothetical protein
MSRPFRCFCGRSAPGTCYHCEGFHEPAQVQDVPRHTNRQKLTNNIKPSGFPGEKVK